MVYAKNGIMIDPDRKILTSLIYGVKDIRMVYDGVMDLLDLYPQRLALCNPIRKKTQWDYTIDEGWYLLFVDNYTWYQTEIKIKMSSDELARRI